MLITAPGEMAEDPVEMAEAQCLIESERRLTQLKTKLDYLRQMARDSNPTNEEVPPILATNSVTDREFKIDRGVNTSIRLTNPFDAGRIDEILKQVQLGPDLTDDQQEEIHELI